MAPGKQEDHEQSYQPNFVTIIRNAKKNFKDPGVCIILDTKYSRVEDEQNSRKEKYPIDIRGVERRVF